MADPTYQEVCRGTTGHAEVCQIEYDPSVVDYADLLRVFFENHDPTQLNRQGNDVGTQYRSVIFYHDEEQKRIAAEFLKKLRKSGHWEEPIVTEIAAFDRFYPAEDYHQNYFNENPNQPYCALVIRPKLEKFTKAFKNRLKA